MNYKEFKKVHIGTSDIAALTLRSVCDVANLSFGGDNSYYAYECFGEVEIPERYNLVFEGKTWLRIYDDNGLSYIKHKHGQTVKIYRCGDYDCIIHWS